MFNRKCTDIGPNHFKSALGGATYVIRFPLVFAVPRLRVLQTLTRL